MTIRSRTETLVFDRPFHLKGLDRLLPAGSCEVLTDEDMIEDLSFPCYQRVLTMIMVPGAWPYQRDRNGRHQRNRACRCRARQQGRLP